MTDSSAVALGQYGFVEVATDQTASCGSDQFFVGIVPDGAAATFSAVSAVGSNLTSRARSEGMPVVGVFKRVACTDGNVLAYYGRPPKRNAAGAIINAASVGATA